MWSCTLKVIQKLCYAHCIYWPPVSGSFIFTCAILCIARLLLLSRVCLCDRCDNNNSHTCSPTIMELSDTTYGCKILMRRGVWHSDGFFLVWKRLTMAALEWVDNTFSSIHTINCFFCHYFRIIPENPHYTNSRNILITDSQDAVLIALCGRQRN